VRVRLLLVQVRAQASVQVRAPVVRVVAAAAGEEVALSPQQ
jgi:hypothetical protein